jgi:hypothetical protein
VSKSRFGKLADKNVLLVEGKDDEHVLYALFVHHALPDAFVVKNKEGVNNILDTLEVELLASELERLGVVVDADTNLTGRWQALTAILKGLGYNAIPADPNPDGTIILQAGKPTVGIWLMPDNSVPGMLEHFVSFLVPRGDSLWNKAKQCLDGIPSAKRLFSEAHVIKAQLYTWLAWQNDPGSPLGLAITKRYLEADSPHAIKLISWVRTLFISGP